MINYYTYPGVTRPAQGTIRMTPQRIINIICNYFGVSDNDVKSKDRRREFTEPRHISWHFLTTKAGMYQRQVGELFDRDHATILHGARCVTDRMSVDSRFRDIVAEIESLL